MWECYNLNFIDGKLGTHSSRVTFSRMQGNLGHNYVNTQADHWSQLLPGGLLHIAAYSHVPPPCAGRVGNKHSREITVLFLNRVNFHSDEVLGPAHWATALRFVPTKSRVTWSAFCQSTRYKLNECQMCLNYQIKATHLDKYKFEI